MFNKGHTNWNCVTNLKSLSLLRTLNTRYTSRILKVCEQKSLEWRQASATYLIPSTLIPRGKTLQSNAPRNALKTDADLWARMFFQRHGTKLVVFSHHPEIYESESWDLFFVFSLSITLESNAMRHFAKKIQRA